MAEKAGKITIIGAGTIGPTVAYALMIKGLASEIILVNRDEAKGVAKASDLAHCGPLTGGTKVRYGGFEAAEGSDIIVVTAGTLADKNGTRMDVLKNNISVFKEIIPRVAMYSPNAVILIVTNPMDVMTYAAYRLSGFTHDRVIGSGTLLDTMRFRQIIGNRLGVGSDLVEAEVVGEHGETMVPLWSSAKVSGVSLEAYLHSNEMHLDSEARSEITRETERAGWNIRLGNVHSCYGIALSTVKVIECILGFSKDIIPVSTLIKGEYGLKDVFLSAPVRLCRSGVQKVHIRDMDSDEQKLLFKSAEVLKGYIKEAESML